jgi:hypothetical protein
MGYEISSPPISAQTGSSGEIADRAALLARSETDEQAISRVLGRL